MKTWYNLQRDLTDKLENRKDELLSEEDGELLNELIDGTIPCNYNDLAALLADNHDLAYAADSGLIDTSNINIFKIIQTAIYEEFLDIAHEWIEKARQEFEDELLAA